MSDESISGDRTGGVLERIRKARFGDRVACPRCPCESVYRWGTFSGRQRYRCNGCRRTFSDLTGTPAAYVKKLPLWEDHAQLLEQGLTLRQVAAALRIHLSTAFDWRHRLLDELRDRDRSTVSGTIQLTDLWFPWSNKGSRHLNGRARRRGVTSRTRFRGATVRAVVACDDNEGVVSALLPDGRIRVRNLVEALSSRIVGRPLIRATTGPLSPAGIMARVLKGTFRWVRGYEKQELMARAQTYIFLLECWLRRFCGVATHYLENYLAWHRAKDRTSFRSMILSWPLARPAADPPASEAIALAA